MMNVKSYFLKSTPVAPLVVFRIGLGIMLFVSIIRFWANGWIEDLYIRPDYFFPYYGFEFVRPLGAYTYGLFAICGLSALFVALGFYYRLSILTLFLSFTYIELIDKTTYLNHYYFVSMICFLMIFLPAQVYFSIDAYRNRKIEATHIPLWCIDALKLFVLFLYVFAGLAKINPDWLLQAMPLKIWLPAHNDMPVIGFLFNYTWVAYAFSWFGCLYDLSIAFLLWNKQTRPVAYVLVIAFHVLTSLLFPIGIFPYVMIVTALIFFSPEFHQKVIESLQRLFFFSNEKMLYAKADYVYSSYGQHFVKGIFFAFFVVQLLLPLRFLCYPGSLFWTEQGYRFSWRVMLMEKAGYAQFTVRDETGKFIVVNNNEFLTVLQEKMMATQPDMMLQYAHILAEYYARHGFHNPQVYADTYVTLNGRLGKMLIDPTVDLAKEEESFASKNWILLYNE
ncbi:HTTM domain-containing protein [Cytophaga hutchinsonii]|uniref:Gamma-glutamyl carboxylase-like protein n=1 Tax=Cytophaga hutchinsonii (strain ATCC 33406 / DSM 1761 / CIP 103989 / NBRC 15051 / NCIMB 9469 / D465) TaxID=269798 RepID=A0A6N4SMV5_CYTH3|nr:HTTM domain-containing protein [Cytophaga hutchinsonii]ABG57602.1 gamma-glutamyl carboxylase-like protein [Cytophaga hutchinsonii ATCC 33406]